MRNQAFQTIREKVALREREAINIRLPRATVRWVRQTAKKYKLSCESIYSSLLLAGIQAFEKEKPLGRGR